MAERKNPANRCTQRALHAERVLSLPIDIRTVGVCFPAVLFARFIYECSANNIENIQQSFNLYFKSGASSPMLGLLDENNLKNHCENFKAQNRNSPYRIFYMCNIVNIAEKLRKSYFNFKY